MWEIFVRSKVFHKLANTKSYHEVVTFIPLKKHH